MQVNNKAMISNQCSQIDTITTMSLNNAEKMYNSCQLVFFNDAHCEEFVSIYSISVSMISLSMPHIFVMMVISQHYHKSM